MVYYLLYLLTEIWLNYGITDVILDIDADNLDQDITTEGETLEDSNKDNDTPRDNKIIERLDALDTSKPIELVLFHYTKEIQKIINVLFTLCEQRSHPIPRILTNKKIQKIVSETMPEGSIVSEFDTVYGDKLFSYNKKIEQQNLPNNLVFISEIELDGLFGYNTIATRLLRRFGVEYMLTAYAKRKDNLPSPGQVTQSIEEAKKFTDNFDIRGIEIVTNSKGIVDFNVGHPSKTINLCKTLESIAIKDNLVSQQSQQHDQYQNQKYKSLIISTGKSASNDSLKTSLNSLWNCSSAIKNNGLAILIAECTFGIESLAIQQYLEDRLNIEELRNPTRYIDGMEDLLFLLEIKKKFQIGLVSILPEFYVKRLDMIPFYSTKQALDYILKTQGKRQKVSIVRDGARILLR